MKKALYLFLSLTIISCAPSPITQLTLPNFKHYVDQFDGSIIDELEGNTVPNFLTGTNVWLNPSRIKKGDTVKYYLNVRYLGIGWLMIPEGNTLYFTINGEHFVLLGPESKQSIYGNEVIEWLSYEMDSTILQKMAYAQNISYELRGRYNSVKGNLDFLNIQLFEQFYSKFPPTK